MLSEEKGDGVKDAIKKKKEKKPNSLLSSHPRPFPALRINIQSTCRRKNKKMECIFETLSFNNHVTILVIYSRLTYITYLCCKYYIKKISVFFSKIIKTTVAKVSEPDGR